MNNGFKDLSVWKKSKDLAVNIYQTTNRGPIKQDFGLRDQIRRSAVSIASNIAEGDERDTNKEAIRFFYFAKGSLAELRTQMEIAFGVGYIDEQTFNAFEAEAIRLGSMIGALIKYRYDKIQK